VRSRHQKIAVAAVAVLIVIGASAVWAQSRLPKLPPAYAFAQTGDSPGVVTFNHESHVDEAAPSCTACHPKLFKILAPGGTLDGKPITHAAMEKGANCGACHDGTKAFGIDDCSLCHR
jgi:c(7)-type cytochrome triheme protein